jgi:hypothetical protein
MNPLQLRQTINHHLNQLSLTHLQAVAQMVAYLAEHERSPLNQSVLDWSEVIEMVEPQTFNLGQTQETTWEQLKTTMSPFAPSQLESPEAPPVYQGKPLSLEDMDRVIQIEAGKRK